MLRFHFARPSFAREKATFLRKALAAEGVEATLTTCRNAYARLCGYRDFHELTKVAESGAHAPSSLVDDAYPGDEDAIASAFGISRDMASRVLAEVRPRAMGRPSTPASLPYYDWSGGGPVPDFGGIALEDDLISRLRPRLGIVLFAGDPDRDAGRLMASVARHVAGRSDRERLVALPAALPPELDDFSRGTRIQPFSAAGPEPLRAMVARILRSVPTMVAFGALRSQEEIFQATQASMSGHLVYATAKGASVREAISGIATACGKNERTPLIARLVAESLRVVCCQIVVDGARGGRTALREFVDLENLGPKRLASLPMDRWGDAIGDAMRNGSAPSQDMPRAAIEAHREGRITNAVRDRVVATGR